MPVVTRITKKVSVRCVTQSFDKLGVLVVTMAAKRVAGMAMLLLVLQLSAGCLAQQPGPDNGPVTQAGKRVSTISVTANIGPSSPTDGISIPVQESSMPTALPSRAVVIPGRANSSRSITNGGGSGSTNSHSSRTNSTTTTSSSTRGNMTYGDEGSDWDDSELEQEVLKRLGGTAADLPKLHALLAPLYNHSTSTLPTAAMADAGLVAGRSTASVLAIAQAVQAERAARPLLSENLTAADVALRTLSGRTQLGGCVCAFDFDNTLRVVRGDNQDAKPKDSGAVIDACIAVPCHIAIASANSNWQKLSGVLQKLYGQDIFTTALLRSRATQTGNHNKTQELLVISDFYDTPLPCIALFDDSGYNQKYATRVGAHFEHVKNTTGVEAWNFDGAMRSLPASCFTRGTRPSPIGHTSPSLPVTASSGP